MSPAAYQAVIADLREQSREQHRRGLPAHNRKPGGLVSKRELHHRRERRRWHRLTEAMVSQWERGNERSAGKRKRRGG